MENALSLPVMTCVPALVGEAADLFDQPRRSVLYQTSLISAFISDAPRRGTTPKELRRYGNFGLGMLNGGDGELIALDEHFFQVRPDGSANEVDDDQGVPFAAITQFYTTTSETFLDLAHDHAMQRLAAFVERDHFNAIRIDGKFDRVMTKVGHKDRASGSSCGSNALREYMGVEGTVVGFRAPGFAAGLAFPGFNLHFISAERTYGGRLVEFDINLARAAACAIEALQIELPSHGL